MNTIIAKSYGATSIAQLLLSLSVFCVQLLHAKHHLQHFISKVLFCQHSLLLIHGAAVFACGAAALPASLHPLVSLFYAVLHCCTYKHARQGLPGGSLLLCS